MAKQTPTPIVVEVQVSARILRHVSRGIYRTPAAALKELVSNAYDAGATEVSINTGFPTFEKIVVTDNGAGISQAQFMDLVQHIGFSEKIAGESFKVPGATQKRRVIGHYGIGLLAVGQLAASMRITSKKSNSNRGFVADLDFDQFEKHVESGIERSIIKDEASLEKKDSPREGKELKFAIGKCTITPVEFKSADKARHFTKIELSAVRNEVKNKLAGNLGDRNPLNKARQRYSATFDDLLKLVREREGGVRQGQYPYEKLCWELAVYCPLPYPEIGLFKTGGKLSSFVALASGYAFSLTVDGIKLKKPYESKFFASKSSPITKVWVWKNEKYEKGTSGNRVSGYIILKPQVRPKILQGILIRESGVAVGLYDTTFMEYPFNEGYKFNQLTGELFVEGLSGALNIDRNSFNETDDKYIAVSAWLHNKLQKDVFPAIKSLQKLPDSRRRQENRERVATVLNSAATLMGKKIDSVKFVAFGKDAGLIRLKGGSLEINKNHRDGLGSSAKQEKVLLGASLVLGKYLTAEVLDDVLTTIEDAKREV